MDFRGEGFIDGTKYKGTILTKDLNRKNGSDQNSQEFVFDGAVVENGVLKARVSGARKFTTVEFSLIQ